jgi:hypothetical protein
MPPGKDPRIHPQAKLVNEGRKTDMTKGEKEVMLDLVSLLLQIKKRKQVVEVQVCLPCHQKGFPTKEL